MTLNEINQVLVLIDQWVAELEEPRLNEQCRESGRNFFDFMQARGVYAGFMAKKIIEATGYNPAQLWRVEDADVLRDAIFRYEGSMAVTEIEERDGQQNRGWPNVKHFWGK